MPLNHVSGEPLEGLDGFYRVVPAAKYKDMPRLTVTVQEWSGKKFKVLKDVERPIWQVALGHAQIAYFEAGAPPNLSYDVLVQEYPQTRTVAFVFCAVVNGADQYVVAPFQLSPEQIADLVVRNQWSLAPLNPVNGRRPALRLVS
jgi:hypothetical protein